VRWAGVYHSGFRLRTCERYHEIRLPNASGNIHGETQTRSAAARLSSFATAAEAIRFTLENFPATHTLGADMQVGDERFDSNDIHRRYESSDYPLRRAV
jgi:hypothetical protein